MRLGRAFGVAGRADRVVQLAPGRHRHHPHAPPVPLAAPVTPAVEPLRWSGLQDLKSRTMTMRYRVLGGTGIEVSVHCLGMMMFGAVGNPDHDDCARIVHAALD